jgi:hypothetical protein
LIVPLAEPHQRAGRISAVCVVVCLAFGVPVIIAGQLATLFGFQAAMVVDGIAVVMICAISLLMQTRAQREQVS